MSAVDLYGKFEEANEVYLTARRELLSAERECLISRRDPGPRLEVCREFYACAVEIHSVLERLEQALKWHNMRLSNEEEADA